MNMLRILGAACVNDMFREALFQDPASAALNYGFPLTAEELGSLNWIVQANNLRREDFEDVGFEICPQRPCVYAQDGLLAVYGAAVVDENFRDALFKAPATTPAAYGFSPTFFERNLLVGLIKHRGVGLEACFARLGARIRAASPITLVLPIASLSATELAAG